MEASQDKPDAKMEGNPAEQSGQRRRWFQFHLSTAVVVVIVIATLIGLNASKTFDVLGGPGSYRCGWPLSWYWTSRSRIDFQLKPEIHTRAFLADLGVAVLIVLTIAVI